MASVNYAKYYNDIERAEYKRFDPLSLLNLNAPNKKTEFNINFGDQFCSSNLQFYISGKLEKSTGVEYDDKTNIKLINNFVPYLFKKIELRKHNDLIEEIEYPGQLNTTSLS